MRKVQVIILAAGKGSRLRRSSGHQGPKALYLLCGRPMLWWVLYSLKAAGFSRPLIVVGDQAEKVQQAFPDESCVQQKVLSGTRTAVLTCIPHLNDADPVFICNVDAPLVHPETYRAIADRFRASSAAMVLATVSVPDFLGWHSSFLQFGQITKNAAGQITAVTEGGVVPGSKASGLIFNAGIYCCDPRVLKSEILNIQPVAARDGGKEFPFTDIVRILARESRLEECSMRPEEAFGVNTFEHAQDAEHFLKQRIAEEVAYGGENSAYRCGALSGT